LENKDLVDLNAKSLARLISQQLNFSGSAVLELRPKFDNLAGRCAVWKIIAELRHNGFEVILEKGGVLKVAPEGLASTDLFLS
jgi:hypothetical protein